MYDLYDCSDVHVGVSCFEGKKINFMKCVKSYNFVRRCLSPPIITIRMKIKSL